MVASKIQLKKCLFENEKGQVKLFWFKLKKRNHIGHGFIQKLLAYTKNTAGQHSKD